MCGDGHHPSITREVMVICLILPVNIELLHWIHRRGNLLATVRRPRKVRLSTARANVHACAANKSGTH
jgi:hypothetical protein